MNTQVEVNRHQTQTKTFRLLIGGIILVMVGVICMIILAKIFFRPNEWTITSYASVTGNQAMIYSIVDNRGRLILIDGGWEEDAEQVRQVIEEHGKHVYAWIITHPHPDHTGAFNVIMTENTDIDVDDIYVTNLDYDRYRETAQWYDAFDACEKYYQIINELDNVHILQENDSFECIGLVFDVLHGWDSNVSHQKDHLCNNGSLMFIVKGHRERMLVCADVQVEMEQLILTKHSDKLHDIQYVQAAHHGNWGLTTNFYDEIENPEIVFFDSTDILLDSGEVGYDAGKLKEYFENRGAEVVNYSNAPNSILLR